MKACRPDMAVRLIELPCFAESISFGIGKRVRDGAEPPIPSRSDRTAVVANAPHPIANLRRVSLMMLLISAFVKN
jgi:hypothetical protein